MTNLTQTNLKNNLITHETEWLEAEDFNQASLISATVTPEKYQWQTYLNSLALSAFKRWFNGRIDDDSIIINEQECSLFKTEYAEILPHITNLQIGNFKYCLIVTESLANNTFKLAKAVCDLPQFVAHFYILIQVLPEEEEIIIHGGFNYEQLLEYKQNNPLKLDDDYTYTVDNNILKFKGDRCIYYTQFLNPSAIKLPVAETNMFALSLGEIKTALSEVKQQFINLAYWFNGQLNQIAKNLNFDLPTPLINSIESGFCDINDFAPAINRIKQKSLEKIKQKAIIPDEAIASPTSFTLDQMELEVLFITWLLPQKNDNYPLEWMLMLILRKKPNGFLPDGITINVKDQSNDVFTKQVKAGEEFSSLKLRGKIDDKILLTINLGKDKKEFPFAFNLQEAQENN
jgi:hypothetical protein